MKNPSRLSLFVTLLTGTLLATPSLAGTRRIAAAAASPAVATAATGEMSKLGAIAGQAGLAIAAKAALFSSVGASAAGGLPTVGGLTAGAAGPAAGQTAVCGSGQSATVSTTTTNGLAAMASFASTLGSFSSAPAAMNMACVYVTAQDSTADGIAARAAAAALAQSMIALPSLAEAPLAAAAEGGLAGIQNSGIADPVQVLNDLTAATTVARPTISPAGSTYTSIQSVTLSSATSGASIYYTTDGTTPTAASQQYVPGLSVISVGASETLTAIAEESGWTNSTVASAAYVINLPCSYAGGSVANGATASRTMYAAASAASPATCSGETQTATCNQGTLSFSGTNAVATCTETQTAYQTSTVPYGSSCVSETQSATCTDGSCSAFVGAGGYTNTTCSVLSAPPTVTIDTPAISGNPMAPPPVITPADNLAAFEIEGSCSAGGANVTVSITCTGAQWQVSTSCSGGSYTVYPDLSNNTACPPGQSISISSSITDAMGGSGSSQTYSATKDPLPSVASLSCSAGAVNPANGNYDIACHPVGLALNGSQQSQLSLYTANADLAGASYALAGDGSGTMHLTGTLSPAALADVAAQPSSSLAVTVSLRISSYFTVEIASGSATLSFLTPTATGMTCTGALLLDASYVMTCIPQGLVLNDNAFTALMLTATDPSSVIDFTSGVSSASAQTNSLSLRGSVSPAVLLSLQAAGTPHAVTVSLNYQGTLMYQGSGSLTPTAPVSRAGLVLEAPLSDSGVTSGVQRYDFADSTGNGNNTNAIGFVGGGQGPFTGSRAAQLYAPGGIYAYGNANGTIETVNNFTVLTPGAAFTVAFWMQANPNLSGYNKSYFSMLHLPGSFDFFLADVPTGYLVNSEGTAYVGWTDAGGSTHELGQTSLANVRDGSWHHVAATFDGNYWHEYIDGFLAETSGQTTVQTPSSPSPLFIGGATDVYGCSQAYCALPGNIADFAVFTRALSGSELFAIASSTQPLSPAVVSESDLVMHLTFNDMAASGPVADLSGNGINGELSHGSASSTPGVGGLGTGLALAAGGSLDFGYPSDLLANAPGSATAVSPSPAVSAANGLTFATWVKTTSTNSVNLFSDGPVNLLLDQDGTARAVVNYGGRFDGSWPGEWVSSGRSSTVVNDGLWHHVAATYDGTALGIYVDGQLSSSGLYALPYSATPDTEAGAVGDPAGVNARIGTILAGDGSTDSRSLILGFTNIYGSQQPPTDGSLASALVFHRAVSAAEMSSLYFNGAWGVNALPQAAATLAGFTCPAATVSNTGLLTASCQVSLSTVGPGQAPTLTMPSVTDGLATTTTQAAGTGGTTLLTLTAQVGPGLASTLPQGETVNLYLGPAGTTPAATASVTLANVKPTQFLTQDESIGAYWYTKGFGTAGYVIAASKSPAGTYHDISGSPTWPPTLQNPSVYNDDFSLPPGVTVQWGSLSYNSNGSPLQETVVNRPAATGHQGIESPTAGDGGTLLMSESYAFTWDNETGGGSEVVITGAQGLTMRFFVGNDDVYGQDGTHVRQYSVDMLGSTGNMVHHFNGLNIDPGFIGTGPGSWLTYYIADPTVTLKINTGLYGQSNIRAILFDP